jgi:hypothetical protein
MEKRTTQIPKEPVVETFNARVTKAWKNIAIYEAKRKEKEA